MKLEMTDLFDLVDRMTLDDMEHLLDAIVSRQVNLIGHNAVCRGCGVYAQGPVLQNEIWAAIAPGPGTLGLLCMPCMESRMGRPIVLADVKDIPFNHAVLQVMRRTLP